MLSLEVPFQALGLTLVHFCWQGAVIAGAARLAGLAAPGVKPGTRYNIHLLALIAMAVTALITFAWEWTRLATHETVAADVVSFGTGTAAAQGLAFKNVLPWLDTVWALGVIALSARMMGGLWLIHRLSAGAVAVPEALAARFAEILRTTGLKNVRLRMHPGIDGPFVVGVFRSIVYLPVSAVSMLTPDQIDAVLAHELEHIRRADFAWNLLQTAIETLFFYHPAVWWLGKSLRDQRELACDDAAVTLCRDPLTYATALLALEERRPARKAAPTLAMALGGKDGSLLVRVRRILGDAPRSGNAPARPALMAAPLIVAMLAALAVPAAQVAAHATETSKKQCRIKATEGTGGSGVETRTLSSETATVTSTSSVDADADESPAAEATDTDVEPRDFWSGLRSKPLDEIRVEALKIKADKVVKAWKIKAKDWKFDTSEWTQDAAAWQAKSQAWADQARAQAEVIADQARASIDESELRRVQADGLREGAEQARRQADAMADQTSREARSLRRAAEQLARQSRELRAEAPEAPEPPEAAEPPEAPEAPEAAEPPAPPRAPAAPPAVSAPKPPAAPRAPAPLAGLDTRVVFTRSLVPQGPLHIIEPVIPQKPIVVALGQLPDARPMAIPIPNPVTDVFIHTNTNMVVVKTGKIAVNRNAQVHVVVDGRS